MTAPHSQPKLSLYYYDGCFYCMTVRRALSELDLEVDLRNIMADRKHHEALTRATGRSTVPVLRIETADGRVEWLPESRDIVRYLRELAGAPVTARSDVPITVLRWAPLVLLVVSFFLSGTVRFAALGVALLLIVARYVLTMRVRATE